MDMKLKEDFQEKWKKYFNSADLPVVFYYTDQVKGAEPAKKPTGHRCIMGDFVKIRKGTSLYFEAESIGCYGGKRYLGFYAQLRIFSLVRHTGQARGRALQKDA
ncbi:MAG: hypothetical protein ACYS91_17710 [Planctomycetota bacterium]